MNYSECLKLKKKIKHLFDISELITDFEKKQKIHFHGKDFRH